jgi:hypothetical protein
MRITTGTHDRVISALLMAAMLLLGIYIGTQDPQFWCNQRWAGLSLNKGGYRSWSVTFRPVITFQGDPPPRAFFPPRFCHVDLRGKSESEVYFLVNGPMRWGPLPDNDP